MAATVGALRVTLGANTAQFEQGMRRAQTQARRTGQNIERSFSQMRVRTVQAFGAVRVAAAGLGIAMGAGVLADQARQAFDFAASLTEASRAIGVTVEQYQILNRAAIDNGASTEDMSRAVGILNRTLGQARAGVASAVETFRALRIDPEQFRSAGELIPVVMDRIRGLRTASEQAAAAQRLMGRGAQALLPLLAQGSDGYNRYAEAAREAGLVTAQQARRADEAADRIAQLAITLRTNLASAMINILPAIENLANAFITVANSVGSVIARIRQLSGMEISIGGEGALSSLATWGPVGGLVDVGVDSARNALRAIGVMGPEASRSSGIGAAWNYQQNWRREQNAGSVDLDLSSARGGGGGGGGGGDAERARKEALREEHQFQSELRRYRMDILRAQQEQAAQADVRLQFDLDIMAVEREQFLADQSLAVSLGELSQERAQELIRARDAAAEEQQQNIVLQQRREIDSEQRDIAQNRYELAAEALQSDIDLAETASERRAAELRLLDLTHKHERAKLVELAAAEELGRAEQARAAAALAALDSRYNRERAGIMSNTQGPWEQFLSSLPSTAARANEALEAVAADGLQSITDGLANAITMTESWGDMFKNVAQQILRDLLRIQIQSALSNLLGAGKGGGGGFLSGLSNLFGGGGGDVSKFGGFKASGGPVIPGRTYVVGEKGPELLTMGSSRGFVTPGRGAGPSRVEIIPSPYFDVVVDGRIMKTGAPLVAAGSQQARVGARVDMHRQASRRIP